MTFEEFTEERAQYAAELNQSADSCSHCRFLTAAALRFMCKPPADQPWEQEEAFQAVLSLLGGRPDSRAVAP